MFKKIIQPNNWKFWISVSIFISLIQLVISINYNNLSYEKPFLKVGDGFDYVASSNAYLINNEFTFFKSTEWGDRSNLIHQKEFDKSLYYAYRSPGYAFVLVPVFKMFYYNDALSIVVFLQTVFYGIAIYLLGLISIGLFGVKKLFYWIFFIGLISPGLHFWNIYIYTESFATSFLITSIFLLIKGLESKNKLYFLFAGLALTESIMLRPFLAPLIAIFPIVIWTKFGLKMSLTYIFIYLSTFIVIDGFWTYRNFIKTNEFIPLAATTKFHKYRNKAFLKHLEIYHELGMHFSYNAWFFSKDDKRKVLEVLPEKLFHDFKDIQKIKKAKEYYIKSMDTLRTKGQRVIFELKSIKLQTEILNEYRLNNNSNWFTSRIGSAKILLNNGTINVFPSNEKINIISSRIQLALNNLIYYFGILATFIAFYRFRKNSLLLSIIFIPTFLFLLFTLVNAAETREMFIPSFFILLFALEFLHFIFSKKRYVIFSVLILLLIFF